MPPNRAIETDMPQAARGSRRTVSSTRLNQIDLLQHNTQWTRQCVLILVVKQTCATKVG